MTTTLPQAKRATPAEFNPEQHTEGVVSALQRHSGDVVAVARDLNIRLAGLQTWVKENSSVLANAHDVEIKTGPALVQEPEPEAPAPKKRRRRKKKTEEPAADAPKVELTDADFAAWGRVCYQAKMQGKPVDEVVAAARHVVAVAAAMGL